MSTPSNQGDCLLSAMDAATVIPKGHVKKLALSKPEKTTSASAPEKKQPEPTATAPPADSEPAAAPRSIAHLGAAGVVLVIRRFQIDQKKANIALISLLRDICAIFAVFYLFINIKIKIFCPKPE